LWKTIPISANCWHTAWARKAISSFRQPAAKQHSKIMEDVLPDLLLLDVMLPGMDGLELLRRLKSDQRLKAVPIILASAKGEESDVVAGLELGAEDYVTKPFSPRVLLARVRTALRRHTQPDNAQPVDETIRVGALSLDASRHETLLDGKKLELSATEFSVLEVLARSPGRVFTRSQIIDAVRGHDYPVTDRSVDVQILAIRKKLGTERRFDRNRTRRWLPVQGRTDMKTLALCHQDLSRLLLVSALLTLLMAVSTVIDHAQAVWRCCRLLPEPGCLIPGQPGTCRYLVSR
jgi:two-component system, OmpR family, alkaline phosphatase synthesis response regulator PhoP